MEPDGDLPHGPVVADPLDDGLYRLDLPGAIHLSPLGGVKGSVLRLPDPPQDRFLDSAAREAIYRDTLPNPCAARSGTRNRGTCDSSSPHTSTPSGSRRIRNRAGRSAEPGEIGRASCRASASISV